MKRLCGCLVKAQSLREDAECNRTIEIIFPIWPSAMGAHSCDLLRWVFLKIRYFQGRGLSSEVSRGEERIQGDSIVLCDQFVKYSSILGSLANWVWLDRCMWEALRLRNRLEQVLKAIVCCFFIFIFLLWQKHLTGDPAT